MGERENGNGTQTFLSTWREVEKEKERERKSANGNPFNREPRRRRARVEILFAGCLMRQSRGVIKCQTNAERESRSERLPHGTAWSVYR